MYSNSALTNQEIRTFFENKKDVDCPITDCLVRAGYQQSKRINGYTKYAAEYSAAHPEDIVEVDYRKASPSQWFHLIKSWCDRRNPNAYFTRAIRCGELYMWMAEVSGVFQKEELEKLAAQALSIAENNTTKEMKPLRTGKSNLVIRDYCFDRIKEAVKKYCEEVSKTSLA